MCNRERSLVSLQQGKPNMAIREKTLEDAFHETPRIAATDASDFTITTQAQLLSTVGNVTGILTALLAGIASISLVVGGIAAVEEAPEGARAYALSMLALAYGAGFAIAVVLLPLSDIAEQSWRSHGKLYVADDAAEAVRLSDDYAPEHLELHVLYHVGRGRRGRRRGGGGCGRGRACR